MKKWFALMLVITMISLSAPVCCADTDKEILFFDTPWGINADEVFNILNFEKGFNASGNLFSKPQSGWTLDIAHFADHQYEGVGGTVELFTGGSEVTIGGYRTHEIRLNCSYDDSNGYLDTDKNKTKYYLAEMEFITNKDDCDVQYEDLVNKLSSLYGDCTEETITEDSDIYTYSVWYGANNTGVCLYKHSNYYNSWLYLMYGIVDSDEHLQHLVTLIPEPDPIDPMMGL